MNEDLLRHIERSIGKLSDDAALEHIGRLIDLSTDAVSSRGVARAERLLDELEQRNTLTIKNEALLQYFRANACSLKGDLAGRKQSWAWEQPDALQEILALSRATTHKGFSDLENIRKCQILTNRGGLLSNVGRNIDAMEDWDRALSIVPKFAMAHANRAIGLKYYCGMLRDPKLRGYFLLAAHDAACAATSRGAIWDSEYPAVRNQCLLLATEIAARVPIKKIRASQELESVSLGRGEKERNYREWCLRERLFLNPLNDLGSLPFAAIDNLTLPDISEVNHSDDRGGMPPPIFGFYNQMKQEFVSARYLLFDGMTASGVHFSDRGVHLSNTLDYPHFSLAMEKVRTSYRIGYSLLDKISYFVNWYWNVGKIEKYITFQSVWHQEKNKSIHPKFEKYDNLSLRGLFWLAKELFDDNYKKSTNPDARELHELRNNLEHKYLQIRESWAQETPTSKSSVGALGKSIYSNDLEAKALRVIKIARSALCYLAFAIGREEQLRCRQSYSSPAMQISISPLDDSWKRTR